MIKFNVKGVSLTNRQLSKLATTLGVSAGDFRVEEAQRVLEKSLEYVPHEMGELASSGEVVGTGGSVVKVQYGAPGTPAEAYALAIHEEPIGASWPRSWRKKGYIEFHGGGGHKYLERAFNEITSTSMSRFAAFLRTKLGAFRL